MANFIQLINDFDWLIKRKVVLTPVTTMKFIVLVLALWTIFMDLVLTMKRVHEDEKKPENLESTISTPEDAQEIIDPIIFNIEGGVLTFKLPSGKQKRLDKFLERKFLITDFSKDDKPLVSVLEAFEKWLSKEDDPAFIFQAHV